MHLQYRPQYPLSNIALRCRCRYCCFYRQIVILEFSIVCYIAVVGVIIVVAAIAGGVVVIAVIVVLVGEAGREKETIRCWCS